MHYFTYRTFAVVCISLNTKQSSTVKMDYSMLGTVKELHSAISATSCVQQKTVFHQSRQYFFLDSELSLPQSNIGGRKLRFIFILANQ